ERAAENQAKGAADFIVAARGYAEANPSPAWLGAIATDEQLLNRLVTEAKTAAPAGVQALGVLNNVLNPLAAASAKFKASMQSAAMTVLDRSGDFASTKLLAWRADRSTRRSAVSSATSSSTSTRAATRGRPDRF